MSQYVDTTKRRHGFDKEVSEKERMIDNLIIDIRKDQTEIRPRRWLDVFCLSMRGYMCLMDVDYFKCFVNVRMLQQDNSEAIKQAEVKIDMMKRAGGEINRKLTISFDDMNKAQDDINKIISEIHNDAIEA